MELKAEIELRHLPLAQERVDALNKRAKRLGVAPLLLEAGKPFSKKLKVAVDLDEDEGEAPYVGSMGVVTKKYEEVEVAYVEVTLTGEGPKVVGGWALAAALERIDELGTVIRAVPGKQVAEKWRTEPSYCDHCKTLRARIMTYVLQSETGEEKQIGSDCLKDFLGHNLNSVFCFWTELDEVFGEFGGGGYAPEVEWLENFLKHAATLIRTTGWVSRTEARDGGKCATADATLSWLGDLRKGKKTELEAPTEKDELLAKASIEWARTVLAEKPDKNDYEHNLFLVTSRDTVDRRHAGIAASLIGAYERYLGREIEKAKKFADEKNSVFLGEVKKRQEFKALTLTFWKSFDGQFGVTTLFKFRDPAGNVLTWWASGEPDLEKGGTYDLKATVKKHEEYNGVKQTVLTRAKVLAVVETKVEVEAK